MANKKIPINVENNDNNNVSVELEMSTTVWKHFTKSIDKKSAVCSLCQKSIQTQGGSTSGLHVHLKSKHKIVISKGISMFTDPCVSVSYCYSSKVVFVSCLMLNAKMIAKQTAIFLDQAMEQIHRTSRGSTNSSQLK